MKKIYVHNLILLVCITFTALLISKILPMNVNATSKAVNVKNIKYIFVGNEGSYSGYVLNGKPKGSGVFKCPKAKNGYAITVQGTWNGNHITNCLTTCVAKYEENGYKKYLYKGNFINMSLKGKFEMDYSEKNSLGEWNSVTKGTYKNGKLNGKYSFTRYEKGKVDFIDKGYYVNGHKKVTIKEYSRIKFRMIKQDVESILGGVGVRIYPKIDTKGEKLSRADEFLIACSRTTKYKWTPSRKSSIIITFKGGLVKRKSQHGLK